MDAPQKRKAAASFAWRCTNTAVMGSLRKRRVGGVLAVAWVLAPALGVTLGADTVHPAAPFRAPYIPASEGEILQEVPSAADPAVVGMRRLRRLLEATPDSLPVALRLADAYVAEAVIAPWMAQAARPAPVLVTQATILQYRHQFAEARDLLHIALKQDPRNAQAWLTLATLDMVQGKYQAAGKNCSQVAETAGLDLGLACSGNLRSYLGKAHQSLAMLQQAEVRAAKSPPAYQAWLQGLIAEAAERVGDWPLAETHYLDALRLLPRDNFLLVAYADFLLDRGRPAEVLTLLADHTQSDTAFLRLALAQSALGRAEAERLTWIMAARFEALALRGGDYFGREQARFALQLQHDPPRALEMARRNWQVQRAPWDVRVLLDAAIAAEQPAAAAEALNFLRDTKLEDPIILPLAEKLRQMNHPAGAAQ
jgi:tetratricopeptide (TPR) repeat protein